MSRPLRIQYPGAWYHVMNRGGNHQDIFCSEKDYKEFLNLLKESSHLWNIRIHAFSLLPNHYHLLIETPHGNLSRAMRHIDGVYTQRFNRHWKRDGHLFRGRYKSLLVEEETYLIELLRYIHLNPVRAGLANLPQEHLWTSHRIYLNRTEEFDWLVTDYLLLCFGKHLTRARSKFHQFVSEGVPEKILKKLGSKRWPTVLGRASFKEWIEYNFVRGNNEDRELKYVTEKSIALREQQVRKIVCDVIGIDWQFICCPKTLQHKEYRRMAVWSYRRYLGLRYEELSKNFGGLRPSTISRIVNRANNQNKENPLWENLIGELEYAKSKT